ncbi:MAG: HAD-IIIC family phosphatase [Bacteroidota bacterium]
MNIAFLTSYNADLIKKDFDKFLLSREKNVNCWWNNYGTQELVVLDKKSLFYSFKPDIIIIHLEIEWLLGDFISDILSLNIQERINKTEETKSRLTSLITIITENLDNAKIVIENYTLRNKAYLGALDINIEFGLFEIVQLLNAHLLSLKKMYPDKIILNDYAGLIKNFGGENSFDYRIFHLAKNPFAKSFYLELFKHYYSIITILTKPRKKCLVVDLDNTLWGGIIGQDGMENIELGGSGMGEAYVRFQKCLFNYYRKGIFLAICSKNNYADAIEVINKHPDMVLRKEYFSSLRINWNDKVTNIRSIAEELNIGMDSLVFVDDNPAECELVRQHLPEVEVINLIDGPINYVNQINSVDSLNTIFLTDEDLNRNKIHIADVQRKKLEENYTNLDDYLSSLEMLAYISINDPSHIQRVSQLTQKTNQFNLTTRRYTIEEIKKFLSDNNHKIYTLRLIDKFGDNGIVLVAIIELRKEMWIIDTFLMSCRVIGRQAETALLNSILEDASKSNVTIVLGEFIKTKKNEPAEDFYSKHGFTNQSTNEWSIKFPFTINKHFIKINREM